MGTSIGTPNLCMAAKVPGIAGPANFQRRLTEGLIKSGWTVSYDLAGQECGVILVIGGSREFRKLRDARKSGIPIVQRLDGMNWIHRQARTGVRHFLRAELNNYMLRIVRDRFADWVVYQSEFARRWWEETYGDASVGKSVIHNGVPLHLYSPQGDRVSAENQLTILMVEGNLSGGYEVGLENGVRLVDEMNERLDEPITLVVVGNVSETLRRTFANGERHLVQWAGQILPQDVPAFYRSADVFFAGDPNPACPNTVIEAMACGTPVVAYDTGAIPELILGDSGRVASYGGDVWKLDSPNVHNLADAAVEILEELPTFKRGARKRAVEAFDVADMVESYLSVFTQVQDEGRS